MKGVMLEDLEDCQDDIRSVAQYPQGLLGTALEDTLSTRNPKAIDHVGGQSEWNPLRLGKEFSLFRSPDYFSIRCETRCIHTCSNAIPRSICTTSPVLLSMRMFEVCLSPSPRMWPTMEVVATLRE